MYVIWQEISNLYFKENYEASSEISKIKIGKLRELTKLINLTHQFDIHPHNLSSWRSVSEVVPPNCIQ